MFSLKILSRYTNLYAWSQSFTRLHAKTKQVRSTLLFIACQNTRKPITENTQLGQSYHHNVPLFIPLSYLIYDNATLLIVDFTRHDLSRWKRIDIYFFFSNRTGHPFRKINARQKVPQINWTQHISLLPFFFFSNYSRNTPTYYIPQQYSEMYQRDKPIIFPVITNSRLQL